MMMAILMLMAVIMMMINENSYSHNSPFEGKVHDYRLPSIPGLIFYIQYIIHLHVGSVMWTLPPARLHQRVYSFCTA